VPTGRDGAIVRSMPDGIEVRALRDPRLFAQLSSRWLATDPFSTNVMGVQLDGVLRGVRPQGEEDIWIVAVKRGRVLGAAMHTPPYHLFLPRLPSGVASQIANTLAAAGRPVSGVIGETNTVAELVSVWAERTGSKSSSLMKMRMYRLKELTHPVATSGVARQGGPDERHLLIEWFERFDAEVASDRPGEEAAIAVERRLAAGELWLWWDGGRSVSVAGHSAAAAGVARVGPAYTPPEYRCQGYGTAVTASATHAALHAGAEHVALYTDLANPVSNSIYQTIGYVADHDAEDTRLIPNS
jgi:predicted GNAT family acetyltransferase